MRKGYSTLVGMDFTTDDSDDSEEREIKRKKAKIAAKRLELDVKTEKLS